MTSDKVYLLDTNIVSELRKTRAHGAVVAWFRALDKSKVVIPAVVIGEIQRGLELTRRQDQAKAVEFERWLDRLLLDFEVIPMDAPIFRMWAKLVIGKPNDLYFDAMIAATAHVKEMTVASRNVADFAQFSIPVFNPFTFVA